MSHFLELCLQPPTLIFSVLMVPVLLYWLLAVFGLVSHGLLHVADAADAVSAKLEGAVAGKAEALGHATDALAAKIEGLAAKADALDGLAAKIEGLAGKADALDGLGAKLEGLAGAKAEAIGQAVDGISSKVESFAGAAQAKIEGFGNAVEAVGGKADGILVVGRPGLGRPALPGAAPAGGGFFGGFGFGEVPRSISWSLAILFGWLTSLFAVALYPEVAVWSGRALWAGAFVSLGALLIAIGLSAVAVQPLRLLMEAGWGQTRNDLVGKVCIIRTQRVDGGFGQAEVLRDGSVVQVRDLEGRGLLRGQQAVIFDYDDEREVFLVAPFDPLTGRPLPIPALAPTPQGEPAASPSPSPPSSRAPQAAEN